MRKWVLVLVATSGCLLPGIDELSGAPGGSGVVDAAPTDANGEGGTDAGATPFCARASSAGALLCDDFESGSIDPRWSLLSTFATMSVSAYPAQGGSKYGLRMIHPPRDAGADGYVDLGFKTTMPANGLEISLRTRVEGPLGSSQEIVIVWAAGSHSPVCFFSPDGYSCNSGPPNYTTIADGALPKPPTGTSTEWQFVVGPKSVRITRDGTVLFAGTPNLSFGKDVEVLIGPEHLFATDPWDVSTDDVLIRSR